MYIFSHDDRDQEWLATSDWTPLLPYQTENLLKGFKLGNEDSNTNFDSVESLYRVDLDEENGYTPHYLKVDGQAHERIASYILDPKLKHKRIENCTYRLMNIIGKMYPIGDKEIRIYINQ